MSDYTKDEALAFIESMRLTVGSRPGFKWLLTKLTALSEYVESVAHENERLRAFVAHNGQREAFDSFVTQDSPPE